MTARSDGRGVEVNRTLLVGGVAALSVGTLLGALGGVATSVAVIGAARSWVRQWDEPPRAVARRRLTQARSAVVAGAQGWQLNGSLAQRQPSVPEPVG